MPLLFTASAFCVLGAIVIPVAIHLFRRNQG